MPLSAPRDLDALRAGVERWLGRPVSQLSRPDPGWSCETVIVDRELVIRLPPDGDGIFPAYDLAQQAAVQAAAGAAGVPVAQPVRYEPDFEYLGAPFVAMPFVDGPIPGAFTAGDPWLAGLTDDGRRAVWDSFLAAIGAIHEVDHEGLGLRVGVAGELEWWERYVGWATEGSPPPALAEALAWCRSHRPEGEEPPWALLWGDVRLGNVVFDPDRLEPRAVLDWDMASVGPAEMDLAWFLALEQIPVDLTGMSVPGFGSRAEAIAVLEGRLGRQLQDLDWHEVFALVRASAVSTRIALLFERAGQPSMFKVGEDPTLQAALARIEAIG